MRVHNLEGAVLDFWTGKAAGISRIEIVNGCCLIKAPGLPSEPSMVPYSPSTNWADGGAIMESAGISIWRYPDLDSWHAGLNFTCMREEGIRVNHYYQGPSALVAAMRCFIASKFGDQVAQSE